MGFSEFLSLARNSLWHLVGISVLYRSLVGTAERCGDDPAKVAEVLRELERERDGKRPKKRPLFHSAGTSSSSSASSSSSSGKGKRSAAASSSGDDDAPAEPLMSNEDFVFFLRHVQGEEEADLPYALRLLDRYREHKDVVTVRCFQQYLMSVNNHLFDPFKASHVYQDMTQPLCCYYINSSHNTYCSSDQLGGVSSSDMYRTVLRKVDCWDGADGRPVIYHGHTMTSKLFVEDVCKVIQQNAFVTSPYPVVLSVENHCNVEQQGTMAAIFRRIFGDRIATSPHAGEDDDFPVQSPEDLKYRILIKGLSVSIAPIMNEETRQAAVACDVFDMFCMAIANQDSQLSNTFLYRYFARTGAPEHTQARVVLDLLEYYRDFSGQKEWMEFGIAAGSSRYGVSLASDLVVQTQDYEGARMMELITYVETDPVTQEFRAEQRQGAQQLRETGARVFVLASGATSANAFFMEAIDVGIVGDRYVWICTDMCGNRGLWLDISQLPTVRTIEDVKLGSHGMLWVNPMRDQGPLFPAYYDLWEATFTPLVQAGIFQQLPVINIWSSPVFDSLFALALTMHAVDVQGGDMLDPAQLFATIPFISFDGMTGPVAFDSSGDMIPVFQVTSVAFNATNSDNNQRLIANHTLEQGITVYDEATFWAQCYQEVMLETGICIPDLEVRQPFDFWSCDEQKKKTDRTGKSVKLETPNGGSADFIDSTYICDQFIDCWNMSDEGWDCTPSYKVLFLIMGIITGLLTLFAIIVFIPFTIIFGFILPNPRVQAASPTFLIIIILSAAVGYISTYAWYGKPHPAACLFQPWLLGLAVVSMISALFAKTFRIWRIFRSPWKAKIISDFELMLLWALLVLPALFILILWTIIATPWAATYEIDGTDHFVCGTANWITGYPGSIVFFAILVAYEACTLLFGIFLIWVTRKVPSKFNESKLIAVSIYNLVFLAVVVIPVYFVLRDVSPFAAWLIRTLAILYAFTATLWLQMIPKIIGICIIDPFGKKEYDQSLTGMDSGSGSSRGSGSASDMD